MLYDFGLIPWWWILVDRNM